MGKSVFDELDQKLKEKEQQQRYESEKIDISMPPVKDPLWQSSSGNDCAQSVDRHLRVHGFEVYEGN